MIGRLLTLYIIILWLVLTLLYKKGYVLKFSTQKRGTLTYTQTIIFGVLIITDILLMVIVIIWMIIILIDLFLQNW